MGDATEVGGPDLKSGIPEGNLANDATLVRHVEGRRPPRSPGTEAFAIGATCTHYGGLLSEGLMVEDTVRRPWHHGCFSLRTGEALAARALTVTALWQVERRNGRLCVCEKIISIARRMLAKLHPGAGVPERMLIIGGGAEGYAAAEMLRRESHRGEVIILSADDTLPYDRPNLSKDDLIGTTPKKGFRCARRRFMPRMVSICSSA